MEWPGPSPDYNPIDMREQINAMNFFFFNQALVERLLLRFSAVDIFLYNVLAGFIVLSVLPQMQFP